MKILFVQPTNAIGGSEYSLLGLVKYLYGKKHSVFISIPYSENNEYTDLLKPYVDGFIFVKPMPWHLDRNFRFGFKRLVNFLYRCYCSKGWHLTPIIKLFWFIKKNRIDLVHTNTMLALDGAIAAKLSGVPHIQHVREAIGLDENSLFKFPFQKRKVFFRRVMKFLHQGVIANSKFTLNLAAPSFDENSLVCIYNSISKDFYVNQLLGSRNELGSEIIIGMVGNVTSNCKNHQLFIKIANEYKISKSVLDFRFNIYGKLPDQKDPYLMELKNLISKYHLESIVSFKGYYESSSIYKEINLLFHTCNQESFGRIYIEAMAMGVPIVTVRGGGALELIKNGQNGFLIGSDNPRGFVSKAEELILNKELYHSIRENGINFSQNFCGDLIGTKIEDYYNKVLYEK